jgi:hypothetical protein
MLKTISTLLAASLLLSLAGCATWDRRDAPWDPKGSQTLFDQIPNWDGAANQVCCGHLRQCRADQTPRC